MIARTEADGITHVTGTAGIAAPGRVVAGAEPDGMDAGGEHHPRHAVAAGGFQHPLRAVDVDLPDPLPGFLPGEPAQVHHRVDGPARGVDRLGVGEGGPDDLHVLAGFRRRDLRDVQQPQDAAGPGQPRAQRPPDPAGRAGDQDALPGHHACSTGSAASGSRAGGRCSSYGAGVAEAGRYGGRR